MDKAHPLTTPMVVRSLEVEKDPFCPRKQDEETLGPEVPYLSAIGALMYLANNTRLDIAFAVNLLARFSSDPTKRHWDGIKHIFRYLRKGIDLGLFFPNNSRSRLFGYADAGYMSDPHFRRSQTGYIFTYCDTAISWKSTKQTMAATSSNHTELLAIHEASRECIWLSGREQVTNQEGEAENSREMAATLKQLQDEMEKMRSKNEALKKELTTAKLRNQNYDIENHPKRN
ncbi:secreted RxLR effector protein 161-like [Apium graveolens]|uniref:secreted RxLR effector protein 161-like n=1 Tax=Apium graveolens TaxID=4045 RepID=UPI003D7BEEF3